MPLLKTGVRQNRRQLIGCGDALTLRRRSLQARDRRELSTQLFHVKHPDGCSSRSTRRTNGFSLPPRLQTVLMFHVERSSRVRRLPAADATAKFRYLGRSVSAAGQSRRVPDGQKEPPCDRTFAATDADRASPQVSTTLGAFVFHVKHPLAGTLALSRPSIPRVDATGVQPAEGSSATSAAGPGRAAQTSRTFGSHGDPTKVIRLASRTQILREQWKLPLMVPPAWTVTATGELAPSVFHVKHSAAEPRPPSRHRAPRVEVTSRPSRASGVEFCESRWRF